MNKRIFLFVIIISISLTIKAQFEIKTFHSTKFGNYFYGYEENGQWGIKYQDEVCVWPQFEELKPINNATFLYKENGLWGVMCPTKRITKPLFEDCCVTTPKWGGFSISILLIISKHEGKYGVIGLTGTKYIEAKYDSIMAFQFGYFGRKDGKWQTKNNTRNGDVYFAVLFDGKWQLLDLLGNVVSDNFIINMNQKERMSFGKVLAKYEANRAKTNKALKDEIQKKWRYEYDFQTNIESFFICKQLGKFEFGDMREHVYETAFIDVPWLEDSQAAKLERDSTNLFVWRNILYESLPPLRSDYEFDETLDEDMVQEEIDLCYKIISLDADYLKLIEQKGYSKESILYQDALSICERATKVIDANKIGIRRVQKQKKLARIIGAMESVGSALSKAGNTLENIKNGNVSQSYSLNSLDANVDNEGNNLQKSSKSFSLAENQSKNTDSRTYANYDSMLSKMRYGNMPYNDKERREWQAKMKSLRQKWEGKGQSFPHSQNESWGGN